MTMKIKSNRFDREFDVETVKAGKDAVNPEDILVVRFNSLKKILEELGEAVTLKTEPIIVPPIVCVRATIKDDTGAEVTSYGSVNLTKESIIPQKFSVETALSRAVSNAVIEYCQFEGRVYSDVAIPPDNEETAPAEAPKPAKAAAPTKTEQPKEEAPKPAAKKYTPKKAEATGDVGDYVVKFGNEYTKGKKLSELSDKSLEWLAGLKPTTADAKEAKEKATAYLASKKK